MDRLLREINATAAARDIGADGLAARQLAGYRRRYAELIDAGWAANPDHHSGSRGRLTATMSPPHMTQPPKTGHERGGDRESMGPGNGHGAGHIDEAALLGTATAAAIALMVGEGAWEPLHSLIGLSLLTVVVVYYERPRATDMLRWELRAADGSVSPGARVVTSSAVLALCACLILAYPLQFLVTRSGSAGGKRCGNTKLSEIEKNDCRGVAAGAWMWTLWLAGAAAGGVWATRWPARWDHRRRVLRLPETDVDESTLATQSTPQAKQ